MQNKSVVLKGAEREQLAAWVQSAGGARDCAAKVGVSKSVLYKLIAEGHAHPSTINTLRPYWVSNRIIDLVCAEFNIDQSELFDKKPDQVTAMAKKAAIYLLWDKKRLNRLMICQMFDYSDFRFVNRIIRDVLEMIQHNDKDMGTYIRRIEIALNAAG